VPGDECRAHFDAALGRFAGMFSFRGIYLFV